MADCSICSIISFVISCFYKIFYCAFEYPIVVFIASFLFVVLLMTNIRSARLLCDFGASFRCSRSDCTVGPPETLHFDYGAERGPHTWNSSASNQSPINIVDEHVQKFLIRELLTWNHYDDLPMGVLLENTGHTVILRACFNGNAPTLSGADLLASYTFVELCFRWSRFNNVGSEHMLNYRKYPMEIQAMHRTGPSGDCTSSYDLLMVSYLYEVSANNPYLDPVVQNLHLIEKPFSKVEIPPFPMAYLCHQFRTNFYSYGGSLTEPPCYQGAEWFVFPEPLAIGELQLNEFRQLLGPDGKTRILRNARPVQNMDCSRVINLNQYNPMEVCRLPPTGCEEQCEDEESSV